ncbi:O-antigen ligase family protein, partial [Rhizobium sp. GCM10022189]|uniref:O-antigen ligase family protein n=1 Tax=Rhizobium sp. GCM10022189 TaxID=3252654 RepID=UPI003623442E
MPWRSMECVGVIVALLLLSGCVFPLIDRDGYLDASEMAKLRLLGMPIYLISLGLLARNQTELLIAVRRSLPFAVLLLLPLVSVLWSSSPALTLQRGIALILSVSLAYLLAILFTPRQLLLLTVAVLGTGMVFSLLMAVAWPGRAFTMGESSLRGVFDNKNALGWNAAIATFACAIMATDRRAGRRIVSIPLLCASLVCLVASQSMTAMTSLASAAVATVFFLALSKTRDLGRATLVLVCLQLVALVLVGLSELLVPLLEAIGKDATLTGRVPLWREVDHAIGRRLLFGYGYQAFWADSTPDGWRVRAAAGWPAPHAHNGFRDTLLSLGLLGFVPLVWTIVRAVRQGATLLCDAPEEGWLWLNVLVIMFLVMNLTETIILTQNSLLFVLFSAAVLMFAIRFPTEARGLTSGLRLLRRRMGMIVAVMAVVMAASIVLISGLKPAYHAESRLMIHKPLATALSTGDAGGDAPLNVTSETERLLSRNVAERVIRDLRLDERPEFNPALRQASVVDRIRATLRGLVSTDRPSQPAGDTIEPVVQAYYKALSVWRDGQSDVVEIGFTAGDPELAAAVPNRLI